MLLIVIINLVRFMKAYQEVLSHSDTQDRGSTLVHF